MTLWAKSAQLEVDHVPGHRHRPQPSAPAPGGSSDCLKMPAMLLPLEEQLQKPGLPGARPGPGLDFDSKVQSQVPVPPVLSALGRKCQLLFTDSEHLRLGLLGQLKDSPQTPKGGVQAGSRVLACKGPPQCACVSGSKHEAQRGQMWVLSTPRLTLARLLPQQQSTMLLCPSRSQNKWSAEQGQGPSARRVQLVCAESRGRGARKHGSGPCVAVIVPVAVGGRSAAWLLTHDGNSRLSPELPQLHSDGSLSGCAVVLDSASDRRKRALEGPAFKKGSSCFQMIPLPDSEASRLAT